MFSKQDTNSMSWEEVDATVNMLLDKLVQSGIGFNVIAPLLRTGGIIGGMLSIKMRIIAMLPIQFKYFYNPTRITQILSIPDILIDIPDSMNILLAEGNTVTGSIAQNAALVLKEKYPHAKIYLATLTKVFGCTDKLQGIEEIFYGRQTDENFAATEEERIKYKIRTGITIFPWEDVEDELADINATM